MSNKIFNITTGVFAIAAALAVASCSDKEDMPIVGGGDNDASGFSLALKGMPAPAGAPAAASQDEISVFQFGPDGLFSKSVLNSYDPEGINLMEGTTCALYCVSGISIDAKEETT